MLIPVSPLQSHTRAARQRAINQVIERVNLLSQVRVSDGLSLTTAPGATPFQSSMSLSAEVTPSLVMSDLIVGGGNYNEDTPSLWKVDIDGNVIWQRGGDLFD